MSHGLNWLAGHLLMYCYFTRPITAGAYNQDIQKWLVRNWSGHVRLRL